MGEVLQIKIGDQTGIQKMGTGSVSDVQPGNRITVQGTRGSDGVLTAAKRAGFTGHFSEESYPRSESGAGILSRSSQSMNIPRGQTYAIMRLSSASLIWGSRTSGARPRCLSTF